MGSWKYNTVAAVYNIKTWRRSRVYDDAKFSLGGVFYAEWNPGEVNSNRLVRQFADYGPLMWPNLLTGANCFSLPVQKKMDKFEQSLM